MQEYTFPEFWRKHCRLGQAIEGVPPARGSVVVPRVPPKACQISHVVVRVVLAGDID